MPKKKGRLELCIKSKSWHGVESIVQLGAGRDIRVTKNHLRLALINGAPPHITADLITAYQGSTNPSASILSIARRGERRIICYDNGMALLHYACQSASSLETIKVVKHADPDAVTIRCKKGKLPVDCLPDSMIVEEKEAVKELLNTTKCAPTIDQGTGGEHKARQERCIEEGQIVKQIRVYTMPLNDWMGAVGGLHSVVEFSYEYRDANYSRGQDSVWIERVGQTDESGCNVIVTYSTARDDLTLFRKAEMFHIEHGLSMFNVYKFAKTHGMKSYCVEKNNCHVFAMDLFNFCLDDEGMDKVLIRENDLPNIILSRVARYLPRVLGSGSVASGPSASGSGHPRLGSASFAVGTKMSSRDIKNAVLS